MPRGGLDNDTIAAIATPPGNGGIGIVRLSGPQALHIALALTGKSHLTPRHAAFAQFHDGEGTAIDSGLALYFPDPHSFTGEDVVEIQAHGGSVVMNLLLGRCLELGARQARPGEFSERAFLNDKIDLVQAEAIADLISAQTANAARQAQTSLQGTFSRAVHAFAEQLTDLRKYVEAAIDFPEEEIDFLSDGRVADTLRSVLTQGRDLRRQAHQGSLFRSGVTVVLAGRPNAGKSSLMNVLAGNDIAIVTNQPGTTRDILREQININGLPLHLTDTAGLRDSADTIEQEGVRRARAAIAQADLTLQMIDDSDPEPPEALATDTPLIRVYNKVDLSGRSPGVISDPTDNTPGVAISTVTGAGMDTLKETILDTLGVLATTETLFSARERHIAALDKALSVLELAQEQFLGSGAGELLAEDLRLAHEHLGSITGTLSSDELLGEIFSSFCIGK